MLAAETIKFLGKPRNDGGILFRNDKEALHRNDRTTRNYRNCLYETMFLYFKLWTMKSQAKSNFVLNLLAKIKVFC